MWKLLFCFGLLAGGLLAQAAGTIQASGSATIMTNPDQAQLTIGVVTDGATAQVAAQNNATQALAVQTALKQLLGTAGSIQTVGYAVNPRYSSGQSPVIIGYTASNTLQVTTYDLALPGPLIDAANQAGANNVGGLSFGLRDPEPVKQQALGQAAKQARAHAAAIAGGLNASAGAVVSAQEGSSVSPISVAGAATTTPIVAGQVSVSATVTVIVQLQ